MPVTRFEDLVRSGSTLATAEIEQPWFEEMIQSINRRFALAVEPRPDVYDYLQERIRLVAGLYWEEVQPVQRKDVLDRFRKLHRNLRAVTTQLSPVRGGLHEVADSEVVNLLSKVASQLPGERSARPFEALEARLTILEELEKDCERALSRVRQTAAKEGRRGPEWTDAYIQLMAEVAERLGIPVTTAGDRTDDPYATPFTVLVFEIEQVLPEGAPSPSLAACAKRIERSLKRLKRPPRQNSPKK